MPSRRGLDDRTTLIAGNSAAYEGVGSGLHEQATGFAASIGQAAAAAAGCATTSSAGPRMTVPLRRRSRPARCSWGKRWTSRSRATVASSRARGHRGSSECRRRTQGAPHLQCARGQSGRDRRTRRGPGWRRPGRAPPSTPVARRRRPALGRSSAPALYAAPADPNAGSPRWRPRPGRDPERRRATGPVGRGGQAPRCRSG